MDSRQQEVLQAYEAMQQAMINKDVEKMRTLVAPDKTFTHMSGKRQTREEFFGEIQRGILNYYGYDIKDLVITVNGERAHLKTNVTLKARVYGLSGSWTLPVSTYYEKRNNAWIQVNG